MTQNLLQVETEAATLDQAVESALKGLNCTRAEVDIDVLQMHSSGVLGFFGKRTARVRVRIHDRAVMSRQILLKLLALSGFDAEVKLLAGSEQIEMQLISEQSSLLIGRHGQTLDALQSLTLTMTDRQTTDRTPISIDVDGYRGRRDQQLQQMAKALIKEVQRTGKSATTPPLPLTERRLVHDIFKQVKGLESHSKQYEGNRKIIILKPRS